MSLQTSQHICTLFDLLAQKTDDQTTTLQDLSQTVQPLCATSFRPTSSIDPTPGHISPAPVIVERFFSDNEGQIFSLANLIVVALQNLERCLAAEREVRHLAQLYHEMEKRALAAEEMCAIGQSAFELTHRVGNDLGLLDTYTNDIRNRLTEWQIDDALIFRNLDYIEQATRAVLDRSDRLTQEITGSRLLETRKNEPIIVDPGSLLIAARDTIVLPSGIDICLHLASDLAPVRIRLNQITDLLHNLLSNAIDAMPAGGKIVMSAQNEGLRVAIRVKDTGVGIPACELPEIFNLRYSTKNSTGFGLWSARLNARRNQGELNVESKPGCGTIFTLWLPRMKGTEISA